MRALRWYGKGDLRLEEVDVPEPMANEALIQIDFASICATDRHIYYEGIYASNPPLTIGHEMAGKIVELKDGSTCDGDGAPLQVGDLVTIEALEHCGKCYFCLRGKHNMCQNVQSYGVTKDGAFADFVRVSCTSIYKLIKGLSIKEGALIEPAACGVHAVRRANVAVGHTVLIYGAGPIGLFILQAAKAAGADKIIVSEVSRKRSEIAKTLGADIVINPRKDDVKSTVKEQTDGMGVDLVFDAVGHPAVRSESLEVVRKCGTIVVVGISAESPTMDFTKLISNELNIAGSFCYSYWSNKPHDFLQAMYMMKNGKIIVDPIITHEFSLKDYLKAFEVSNNSEESVKVGLRIH